MSELLNRSITENERHLDELREDQRQHEINEQEAYDEYQDDMFS